MSRLGEFTILITIIVGGGVLWNKMHTMFSDICERLDHLSYKVQELQQETSNNDTEKYMAIKTYVDTKFYAINNDISTINDKISSVDYFSIRDKCDTLSVILDGLSIKWPQKLQEMESWFASSLENIESSFKTLMSKTYGRLEAGLNEAHEILEANISDVKRMQHEIKSCKRDISSIYEELQTMETRAKRR